MEKGIVVVDESLPLGLKANICAILGMTLGKKYPDVVGHNIFTQDGHEIPGITQIPLPILQGSRQRIFEIFKMNENSDVFIAIFDNSALITKNYAEFQEKISSVSLSDIQIFGLLAYGEKKSINKISADLPLLR